MLDYDNILLYRMVHINNVEYILRNGICCREHHNADPDYINIGHRQLIADRHIHSIPLDGAGNLGEYVPFYFAGHTPMLYLIMNGYKGVEKRPQKDIVFLVTKFGIIKDSVLEYVFTNMNAKIAITDFFNNEKDFDKIDWEIVRGRFWNNDLTNMARQDLKQAEFLIRNHVPVKCISSIFVKTEARKTYLDNLITQLNLPINVFIDKKCKLYY